MNNKPDLTEFRERCKKEGIIFNTAYDYKKRHPEMTDDQIFDYYKNGKTDFNKIKKLCTEQNIEYKNYIKWRRLHAELHNMPEKDLISYYKNRSENAYINPDDVIGLKNKNKLGLEMEVIAFRKYTDADIRFNIDGAIVKHTRFDYFRRGSLGHPTITGQSKSRSDKAKEYIGQSAVMRNGMKVTITAYRKVNDIDITFEDGTITKSTISQFKQRHIKHPNYDTYEIKKQMAAKERIGQTSKNNDGHTMTIIEYIDSGDCTLQRDDGLIAKHRTYQNFIRGAIDFRTYEDRIGEKHHMHNGLWATITGMNPKNKHVVNIEFDDGIKLTNISYSTLTKGEVAHPNLNTQAPSPDFHGFAAKPFFTDIFGDKYYDCECKYCHEKTLLTPQEMFAHSLTCKTPNPQKNKRIGE